MNPGILKHLDENQLYNNYDIYNDDDEDEDRYSLSHSYSIDTDNIWLQLSACRVCTRALILQVIN